MLEADLRLKQDAAALWDPRLRSGSYVAGAQASAVDCQFQFRHWIDVAPEIAPTEVTVHDRWVLVHETPLRVQFENENEVGDCSAIALAHQSEVLPALNAVVNNDPAYDELRIVAAARIAAQVLRELEQSLNEEVESAASGPELEFAEITNDEPSISLTSKSFAYSLAPQPPASLIDTEWEEEGLLSRYVDAFDRRVTYTVTNDEWEVEYFISGGVDFQSPTVGTSAASESTESTTAELGQQCDSDIQPPWTPPPDNIEPIPHEKQLIPGFDDLLRNFSSEGGGALNDFELADRAGGEMEKAARGRSVCALRLSFALAESGAPVQVRGNTNTFQDSLGRGHIRGARALARHLRREYGHREMKAAVGNGENPNGPTNQLRSKIANQNGIIVFLKKEDSLGSNHVDLWNGEKCVSICYWPTDRRKFIGEVRFYPLPDNPERRCPKTS